MRHVDKYMSFFHLTQHHPSHLYVHVTLLCSGQGGGASSRAETHTKSSTRDALLPLSLSLQDSEELSDEEEEMKIAEMRPPLIEISINQPKVVTLSKDKKGKCCL